MQLYVLLALCGVALAKETFIVGGRNVTEPGKWPWMVRLQTFIVELKVFYGMASTFSFD